MARGSNKPWADSSPIREIRTRLIQAGSRFDFRLGAWRCPACRVALALRLQVIEDGSVKFTCRHGCEPGVILAALGLTFVDVGPTEYRKRAA